MNSLFAGQGGNSEGLRFVEEKAAVGIWEWDLRTNEMAWSEGLYRLLGIVPSEVRASYEAFNQCIHPDDIFGPGEIEAVLRAAGSIDREFRIIQPNGRMRRVLNRGEMRLDRSGRQLRAIGVLIDITRQHEMNAPALRRAERLSTLVDTLPAYTWFADASGEPTDVIAWCRLTGQTADQASGLGRTTVVHEDHRQRVRDAYINAIANKAVYVDEYILRVASGSFRWVRSKAVPVFETDGRLREWIESTIDIHADRTWTTRAEGEVGETTGCQIRAARAIVNWSVRDLAEASTVSPVTIRRLEEISGRIGSKELSTGQVRGTLERAGVEFIFLPRGLPGVRPKRR